MQRYDNTNPLERNWDVKRRQGILNHFILIKHLNMESKHRVQSQINRLKTVIY